MMDVWELIDILNYSNEVNHILQTLKFHLPFNSTEVAFALLTQLPRVQISALLRFFLLEIFLLETYLLS